MDNASTCKEEQALIMAIIKKKYGEVDELSSALASFDPHFINKQIIEQGDRRVVTACSRLPDVDLYISSLLSHKLSREYQGSLMG